MKARTKFSLSALAKNYLLKIFDYTIHKWGVYKARIYAQKLSDGFEILAQSPEIGSPRDEIYKNAMSFPIGSHLVFYSINKELETSIEIARILHHRMDFKQQF